MVIMAHFCMYFMTVKGFQDRSKFFLVNHFGERTEMFVTALTK